jgi:hypothetical protein
MTGTLPGAIGVRREHRKICRSGADIQAPVAGPIGIRAGPRAYSSSYRASGYMLHCSETLTQFFADGNFYFS